MSRKKNKCLLILCFELNVVIFTFTLSILPYCVCLQSEAILLKASPAAAKHFHLPHRKFASTLQYDHGSSNYNYRFKPNEPIPSKKPTVIEEYFQIEPSDAIDSTKYSQPAVDYHEENLFPDSVPSKTNFKDRHLPVTAHTPSQSHSQDQTFPSHKVPQNSSPPMRDLRFLETTSDIKSHFPDSISKAENKILDDKLNISQSDMNFNRFSSNSMPTESSNITDSITHLLPVSSDNVLSYENPSSTLDRVDYKYIVPVKKSSERAIEDVPSHYLDNPKSTYPDSNFSTLPPMVPDVITEPPFVLNSNLFTEFVNQTESLNSVTTVVPSIYDVENISSSSISFPSDSNKLSSGTVAGIVIGVLVCATILSSAVIYLLYQKYNGKCTSVVEGKFNSDNCGYLDDSLRSSIYLNNHIELPKESSEEMSSLDNDSFLNSLETMTIQNYWADTSKNTKV